MKDESACRCTDEKDPPTGPTILCCYRRCCFSVLSLLERFCKEVSKLRHPPGRSHKIINSLAEWKSSDSAIGQKVSVQFVPCGPDEFLHTGNAPFGFWAAEVKCKVNTVFAIGWLQSFGINTWAGPPDSSFIDLLWIQWILTMFLIKQIGND